MSVRITLHCDKTTRYGGCPNYLMTDALTIEEARTAGGREGWRILRSGVRCPGCPGCPGCSGHRGTRPGANVVHLHPEGSA